MRRSTVTLRWLLPIGGVAAVYTLAARGPVGLAASYRRSVRRRSPQAIPTSVVAEDDVAALPPPVQRYVRMTGAVGRPQVGHFRARWRGRIRATPADPWMEFEAVQHNVVGEPSRDFVMRATRSGLPVDVLHSYHGGAATMRVRALSLVPVASAAGPDMDRGETVTVFNDLCVLAPGALTDARIRWEPVDDRTARGWYTVGGITVSAVLSFNEHDELVDFVSDDRLAMSADGSTFVPRRWSTPLWDYGVIRSQRVWTRGEAWWHPADAPPYAYLEGELVDVEMNPAPAAASVVPPPRWGSAPGRR